MAAILSGVVAFELTETFGVETMKKPRFNFVIHNSHGPNYKEYFFKTTNEALGWFANLPSNEWLYAQLIFERAEWPGDSSHSTYRNDFRLEG